MGNSYNRSVEVTLPEGISGDYYIVAKTGGPFEFIYNDNNTSISDSFDVTFTPAPDLQVTNIIAPDAITSGQTIDLTWTVANQGVGNAQGQWRDHLYLQEVGNPDGNLISLAGYSYEGELKPGKSYTRQEKIRIPSELQGLYQVVVKTNTASNSDLFEPNKNNNETVDDTSLQVTLPPRPDLQVQSIIAPDTVSAGGTVAVEFNVINQGTAGTNIPNWTDNIYLSLDNQVSSDDIVLDVLDNGSALKPGESYKSFTESIVIPKRFRGDAYLIVSTDASNQVNELPQENNNTQFKQIEVEFEGSETSGSGQPSDLVTSDVVAPIQAFEGSTIEVRYKVTNKGIDTTDTNRWEDTIWLTKDKDRPSASNRLGGGEDILLKTIPHNGELAVDEEYEQVVQVTIPSKTTGEWYITPWSDAYDVVLEDTFDININPDDPNELDNNNYKARPITLLLTPPPDLRLTDVTATPEAKGGDTFEVSWTVENNGGGETTDDSWFDEVYLSDSPTLNAPGSKQWFLGTIGHTGGLEPGVSYTQTANFDLSPAAAGKYVIVETNAYIPGEDQAWEGPYTENNFGITDTNVTNSPADLVVKSVTVPEKSDSGEIITVEWSVENQGAPMWSGTKYWYDEVWISRDPTFIRNRATNVGSFIHTPDEPLGTGDTYTQNEEIRLPAGVEGEYYVYVSTDFSYLPNSGDRNGSLSNGSGYYNTDNRESYIGRGFEDPSNNLSSSSLPVIYKEPDLKITDFEVPDEAAFSGDTVPVSWTTTNIGTRETRSRYWYDRVYLSSDPTLDFNDRLLGQYEHRSYLNIDQSYNVTRNVTLPENIEGDFYLLAFTDSNIYPRGSRRYPTKGGGPLKSLNYYEAAADNSLARIGEYQDEGNNVTVAPLSIILREPPDLQVTNVDIPQRATVGQSFDLSYTVTNEGAGNPTTIGWSDRIYLSRDQFLDPQSDRYLTSFGHRGGLDAGESYTVDETVNLPTDLSGPYYVFAISDPAQNGGKGAVFEGGLDFNNSLASTQPLSLDFPPPADLQVTDINIPSDALSGDNIDLKWTVTNAGPNTATGQWSDALYLSTDAIWDIKDRPLGKFQHTGKIEPGESYTHSLNTNLPPAAPGQYRVIVRPDILNQVYEAENEVNNRTASPNPLNVTVEELNLGILKETTLSTGQSRLYQVEVGAGETLRVSVDSSSDRAANEVFIKQGTIPTGTDYDYAYKGGLEADQDVTVPTTEPGTYYVLVKGFSQPGNNTATNVIAESVPFSITNVIADSGGDSNYVTAHIYGARFDPEAIVKFVRPGIAEYQPVSYEVIDGTHIIAIFDFTDAPRGLYDVKAINPDGEEAIVPYRYLVERAIETDVTVGLGGERVLGIGQTGLYGTSFNSLTNIDTPYIHFQYGVPELGDNDFLLGKFSSAAKAEAGIEELPYVGFSTNLRGTPAEVDEEFKDLPWASLESDVNTDGEILAPGYIYDLPNAGATGLSFNATAYPGLNDLLEIEPNALDDLEPEDDKKIAFQFHIGATATVLTRDEFIAQQTQSALDLRDNILNDSSATQTLQVLAADPDTWVASYLAALESAGLLRTEEEAPPVRERTQVLSYMATLATGILVGAAGESIITDGDLLGFFAQLRTWYGHDENLTGVNEAKDIADYDLVTSKTTHQEAFDIYVPFGEQRLDLPDGTTVPNPNFANFLAGEGEQGLSNITGPISLDESGFIPTGQILPYTIAFANDPNASSTVGEIRVVTELDPNLDPRSFRLGDLKLGDIKVSIPDERGTFEGEFDFTGTKGFILRVSAGIDPLSNTATWLLQAINPETGELITNPDLGILPPNDAQGAGSGFISYSAKPNENIATGTEIAATARILYNNAPPLDTPTITNLVDGAAPATTVTVEPLSEGSSDYLVKWDAVEEENGSGVKHVTVYVAEDGGNFTIWQQQTIDTEAVFTGEAGKTYEFLALATDNAGNREVANLGASLPDDGSGTNLGSLPNVGSSSEPTPAPASPPNPNYRTNPIFSSAKQAVPNTINTTSPSEFDSVLRPFKATAFATDIPTSHGNIAPMAIAELEDDTFLISGGLNRGSLYKVDRIGGEAGSPLIELPYPVFEMELDELGYIWATTGGGPLLQLDSATGEILNEYGDGITQSVAKDPETGLVYLSSGDGIEIFDPVTESFTHFSNLRVGNLEFAPDGSLWATRWPERGDVVKFPRKVEIIGQEDNNRLEKKPQLVLELDSEVDSIAFGKADTELNNLLFVSNNDGELGMMNLANRDYLTVADGGSRGDMVETTSDGRLLISGSNQVDVFTPVITPEVAYTNPANEGIVALPKGSISVTFDQEMYVGEATEASSLLNPANYALTSTENGELTPNNITYDAQTNTVTLEYDALNTDTYRLVVADVLSNPDGVTLEAPYQVDFTAVSDFSELVDLEFTNTRSDRANQTVSFDVALTNQTDYDLSLPLNLVLQPGDNSETVEPTEYDSISDTGAYFIDLSDSLTDGSLKPGESITEQTVTIYNPDELRFEFEPGVYTLPTTNQAPVFTSEPVALATAGESYVYNVAASDPDGSVIGYLLYNAPVGMAVDNEGKITWSPTGDSPSNAEVSLHVYDSRGGRSIQEFTVAVDGGNEAPVFLPLPEEINGKEGELIELNIAATDADGDDLQYWVDNLPPGASFDPETNIFTWLPGYERAGTYEEVRFVASDGVEEVNIATTFLIAQGNQAPALLPVSSRTFLEGDAIRIQLQASDSEDDKLTFSSNLLPGGSFLDPNTGVFEWTPGFFQAGNYEIPFTVSDGSSSTTETFNLELLNVNAAPQFDNLGDWAVAEGQTINFRAFAYDGDNPSFVPQQRTAEGELTLLEGSDPTVTYTVEGLPEGATFDTDTAIFNWQPDYGAAGEYSVTFTATDDGDGLDAKTVSKTVPIRVGNANRPPVIEEITNPTVQRGEVLDLTINTTDPDGNALTVTATGNGGFGLPDFVTLTDNGDGTANLNIAPVDGDRGDYPVTIIATDELGSTTEYSFIVTAQAENEKPLLQYIGNKVAVVDEPIEFTVNVADLDEDALTFSATGLPPGATLTPSNVYGQAIFSWTPTAADLGDYAIAIFVEDSGNGDDSQKLFSEQSFELLVRTSNTAPVFGAGEQGSEGAREFTVAEGESLSVTFAGTDADGDTLTYSANNLPAGAELDPVTGELTWTPDYRSAGRYEGIELSVSDGHSISTQTINIVVDNSDRPPVLTPLTLQSTRENTELVFNLKGNDIDGDPLLYSAVSELPEGARIDSRTGEFKWKPNYGQAGDYKLEFAVTDSNGSQDIKEVEIVVANVNRAPSIEVKPQIVALGEELEFTLSSSDPDAGTNNHSPLQYSVENLPEGATLDATTGVVKWQPSPGQVGDYVVTYQVTDGEDTVEKNALIRVETEPTPPVVNLEFTPSFPPIPGQKVFINALADSFTEIETVTISVNGRELTLDDRNRAEFTPDTAGRVEVEMTATDAAGRTATTTEILKVRDPEDDSDPVVAFGLGLNGEAFSSETEIKATVSDRNLDEWSLTIDDEVLATGYGNVSNDVLTTLDPALYANGFYTLELTATDIKGRKSTTEIIVEVEGNDKKAQYQRVESDLTVDFGGTTIDLTRRYDSLQRNESGSFGNGWSSSWNFDLETDVEIRGLGNEGIKPFETGTRLYLTLPDGERVGFTFEPVAEEITGLTYYRPAWVADDGVNYTLQSTDVLLSKAGDRFYDLQTAKPYNLEGRGQRAEGRSQETYTLTTTEGTVYQLDSTGNLESQITDDGTRLIYSDSGILNPDTGEVIRFESDNAGRLTTITAPNGTSIFYTYDEAGDLVSARNLALGDSVRYSYGESGLNLIAGDTGEAIEYFDTPVVKPITADLGTASNFTGLTTAGNGSDLYSFGFRESEIKSTNTEFVLLGVDINGTNELPNIEGLTPVSTQTSTDSSFALYTVDRSRLNLLSVNSDRDYELELGIAGDVNGDNAVDGVDSQLVTDALNTSFGDAGYDLALDVNRDRTIDATDVQILGSNYGFRYNQAPVVTDGDTLTHEDLSIEIPLADLADDPEGDRIFFKATEVENGTVTFTADGQTAIFKPNVGYTGTASFKLFADDGYAVSDASIVEINVSDAPLTSLDFVERNPKLNVGEQVELQVIADFADQEDVIVPGDYLNWSSEDFGVANISDRGTVTGVNNGTSVLSIERDGLSVATVSRIGEIPYPNTDAEFNSTVAEYFGLDVYPDAVTLTKNVERQIFVGIENQTDSPELNDNETGTRYFVNNPKVISVDEDGLITTLTEGEAEVTVIHGGAETVIPVSIETPNIGAIELNAEGGIVENSDGYQVMIPEGALAENTEIGIISVEQSKLTTPLPQKFETIDAFKLSLGDEDLAIPGQLAIPAPEGLEPGTEVFFMRDGELPDETGTWNPIWLIEESGIVGDDGMIRTSSPPWQGIAKGDDYIITVPKFEYQIGKTYGGLNTFTGASNFAGTAVVTSGVGSYTSNIVAVFGIPTLYEVNVQTVEVIAIPRIGSLPTVTPAGVTINPQGVPTASVEIEAPYFGVNNPFTPPVLEQARLDFIDSEDPIVYLSGNNFLVDNEDTDVAITTFDDLTPTFYYQNKEYEGEVVTELSQSLGENRYEIAVKVPQTVILSESNIGLTRTQSQLNDLLDPSSTEEVPYESENKITIKPDDVELILSAQAFADQVSVFNALNPEEILAFDELTSRDLLLAQIPVGTGGNFDDDPRGIVATNDASRAYVSLRESSRLAVIDLMSLQQVDTNPETADVIEPIQLPNNASPHAIATSADDRYVYVGDYKQGIVYIIDIDSSSETYHQVVQTVSFDGIENGIRSFAINSDGKKLFASAPGRFLGNSTGKVFAINIDPEDKPGIDESGNPEPNIRKWHEFIGSVEVENGVEGISSTPDPNVMIFTNRREDFKGFGRINLASDDPNQFSANVNYTTLGLGSTNDYFDVNDARDVVITSDGKYAFVAGFNGSNYGSGAPSIDGPKAGSNVGIIVNPLTPNAKLIGATRPIPMGLTSSLTISSNDKYLFASYPGSGSVFAWDVEEMIYTLQNADEFIIDHRGRGTNSPVFNSATQRSATTGDLTSVPIDNINPNISIAADLQLVKDEFKNTGLAFANEVEFGVPIDSRRAPLTIGFNPWSIANASTRDWLNLLAVDDDDTTEDFTPTLEWTFDEGYEDVQEVNLFVSAFPENEGLLPSDRLENLNDPTFLPDLSVAQKKELLTEPWQEYDDFNPGRIVTATWKKETNTWYWHDGETRIAQTPGNPQNTKNRLTIPDELALTLGQDYYWAVEATSDAGEINLDTTGEFQVVAPINNKPFSSVSVITHGFNILPTPGEHKGIPKSSYQMAEKIVGVHGEDKEGVILRYDKPTGNWVPVEKNGLSGWRDNTELTNGLRPDQGGYMTILGNKLRSEYRNRPIILLTEWSTNQESTVPDSGFTEGAADAFFASMVKLDQQLGGKVGDEVSPGDGTYDESGELRREQGDLFNSPMHFIGFSRGTVVNSEIIQRLGTYYPLAGGFQANGDGDRVANSGDLQMTTIDPHDFAQDGLTIPVGELTTKALSKAAELTGKAYKNPRAGKIASKFIEYASKITRFNQETLDYSDFKEPPIQVWDNISFADNYYQTTNTGNIPINLTPNGRELVNTNPFPYSNAADLNLDLTDFRGFKGIEAVLDKPIGGAHSKVLAWYAGTVNQALQRVDNEFLYEEDGIEIQNQQGEVNVENWYYSELDTSAPLWYSSSSIVPDEYDPEEGIGTGWHYSFLNSGERPNGTRSTVTPDFDNTSESRSRGDFAVPTLFNGNFDASFSGNSESVFNNGVRNFWGGSIPGWSYHNGRPDQFTPDPTSADLKYGINIENLVDWKNITSLSDNYREQVGYSETQPNFALKMDDGDSIVHNRFVVPDWGDLRFDLHVPESQLDNGKALKVFVQGNTDGYQTFQEIANVKLSQAFNVAPEQDTEGNDSYEEDIYRIDFGSTGFETFDVEIPDVLRGKIADLKFEVTQDNSTNTFEISSNLTAALGASNTGAVYLDNVSLKSYHLKFGNPTKARNDIDPNDTRNNFLIEHPQFVVGYNGNPDQNIPNWVAWQLDESWIGNEDRTKNFRGDKTLNGTDLYKVKNKDYNQQDSDKNDRTRLPGEFEPDTPTKPLYLVRGHLANSKDRTRTKKDNRATFLTTNIIPQHPKNNGAGGVWYQLETVERQLANNDNELFIYAGSFGTKEYRVANDSSSGLSISDIEIKDNSGNPVRVPDGNGNNADVTINVPEYTWKVIVKIPEFNSPIDSFPIGDDDGEVDAFALIVPNDYLNKKKSGEIWTDYVYSIAQLEQFLNQGSLSYDFLSTNVPDSIKNILKGRNENPNGIPPTSSASLLAASSAISPNTTVWHNSVTQFDPFQVNPFNIGTDQIGFNQNSPLQVATSQIDSRQDSKGEISVSQIGVNQNTVIKINAEKFGSTQISPTQIGFNQFGVSQISSTQFGFDEIGSDHFNLEHSSPTQISFSENSLTQTGFSEDSPTQISSTQVGFTQIGTQVGSTQVGSTEIGSTQVGSTQVGSTEIGSTQVGSTQVGAQHSLHFDPDSSKVSFSDSISTKEFFGSNFDSFSHDLTSTYFYQINDTATNIWSDLLQSETQLDIDFQITDLPSGQLAEATIKGFDDSGKPNEGTILIDHDANGIGWFIDSTPLNNSEFITQDIDSYLLATAESEANGKYDLLTTVLHELAHLYGFIDGYEGFDANIETKNSTTKFIGDNFEATLDGEHLDKIAHPHDLLNTHLSPGMRKLPSELDVQILQSLIATELDRNGNKPAREELLASLTSDPLLAIGNGDFSISDTTVDSFVWDTRGASAIENGQAVLTEDSPFLSNFTQTFTVPESAKTIQFKLIETELGTLPSPDRRGAGGEVLAPPDAFEVALLDANTNESLATEIGLTETDSLLNIQNDGTAYFSDKVRIGGAASGEIIELDKSRTVTVDISDLTPGTEATLYFDLLGFGEADSRVVIDDVKLSDQNLLPPTAIGDTATTTQGQPVIIDILANDTDDDGTIAVNSVQIQTEPNNGSVIPRPDGTVSYIPDSGFAGADSFTYVVQDNDGQFSEPATVEVTVENAAPEITDLLIPDNITEGVEFSLSAITTDAGNDELTYTWELDDGTTLNGQTVTHTYANNGTYSGTLTVTDPYGDRDTQSFEVTVNNAVPVVNAGSDRTVDEGSAIAFNGSKSDTGINDSHTVIWDFGDGETADTSQASHTYTDDGEYIATYTVTDSDGAIASDTITITVSNVSPVIESLTGDTAINEGDLATFSAIASDPGDDTLTYIWDFGDGSKQLSVNSNQLPVSHIFTNNGSYTVTLSVTDSDGASTSQTLNVAVSNVAPIVESLTGDTVINEGDTATFNAIASDAGNDSLTYTWDLGNGTQVTGESVDATYTDNGVYNVALTVSDGDGGIASSNLTITVNNVAPTIEPIGDITGNEGEAVEFEFNFSDGGILDTHTVEWDFGDGTEPITVDSDRSTINHVYADNGNYEALVTITDNDGASTTTKVQVAIANVAPTIDGIIGATEINEGETVEYNAIASDPGDDELSYTWNFNDGTPELEGSNVTRISHKLT